MISQLSQVTSTSTFSDTGLPCHMLWKFGTQHGDVEHAHYLLSAMKKKQQTA